MRKRCENATALGPSVATLIVVLVAFVVYARTLGAGFVWDARVIIVGGDFIHDYQNWWNVISGRVMSMDVVDFNRPVHLASLMLDSMLWGRNPFGYHLSSNLLHALNAGLVFLLIHTVFVRSGLESRDWRGLWAALLGALVFALHPVQCEAVCEPTFREDSQVLFFSLAALLVSTRRSAGHHGHDWRRLAVVWGLIFLAVASKESGAIAPVLLLTWWLSMERRGDAGYWIAAASGGLLIACGFLALRFHLEPAVSAVFEAKPVHPPGGLVEVVGMWPRVLLGYLLNLFDTSRLAVDYSPWLSSGAHGMGALLLAGMLCVVLLGVVVRGGCGAFAAAMVFLPLLPTANIIPIYSPMADRHLYFTMAGIGLCVGLAARRLFASRSRMVAWSGLGASIVLCAALAVANWHQQRIWISPDTLFEHMIEKDPDSFLAHGLYASALTQEDELERALHHTLKAIELEPPDSADFHLDAAKLMIKMRQTAQAAMMIKQVAIPSGAESKLRYRLLDCAMIHHRTGNMEEAVRDYRRYLEVDPAETMVLNNLAWILATWENGDPQQAVRLARAAVEADPTAYRFRGTLAVALVGSGDRGGGLREARIALEMAQAEGDAEAAAALRSQLLSMGMRL